MAETSERETVNLKRRPKSVRPVAKWNLAGFSFGISIVALLGAGISLWMTLRSQKQLTGSRSPW
jgi:hypothetical protein